MLGFNSLAHGKFQWNIKYVIFKCILGIDGWSLSCEIALIWMSLDFTDDQSTLVQVMAWCRQATGHYLSQCWHRSLSPYGVTRPQWVNLLHAKFFRGNINIYIHFMSLLHIDMTQLVKILALVRQDLPILRSQYHGCWWSGDARSQGINNHDIDHIELN